MWMCVCACVCKSTKDESDEVCKIQKIKNNLSGVVVQRLQSKVFVILSQAQTGVVTSPDSSGP